MAFAAEEAHFSSEVLGFRLCFGVVPAISKTDWCWNSSSTVYTTALEQACEPGFGSYKLCDLSLLKLIGETSLENIHKEWCD